MKHVRHRKEDDKMNEIKEYTEKVFEDIKHIAENGNEYWLARELQNVLGYHQWRSINELIERAKVACKESCSCLSTLMCPMRIFQERC